jgi:AcrR family transcriptional regulator
MAKTETTADERLQRGQETRRKLIEAGVRLFGARGYEDVTTRDLATAAGCNQAAILYHFGGKEQVYRAVAEQVAERVRARLLPSLPSLTECRQPDAAERLAGVLRTLCRLFLELAGDGTAAFVIREQTMPGPGFAVLYEGWMRPTHECVTELVAAAGGDDPEDEATIVRAHAVIGLALNFALTRTVLLKRARWRSLSPEKAERVLDEVAQLAQKAVARPARRSSPRRRRGQQESPNRTEVR